MATVIEVRDDKDGGSYEEFWSEVNDITQNKSPREDDGHASEDELSKPDEGEEERTWLQQAGLGHLINKIEAGDDLQELQAEVATLTTQQATAVKKRVETLRSTVGRTKRYQTKVDVRDVFSDITPATQTQVPPSVQEGPHKATLVLRNDDKRKHHSFLRKSKNYDMGGDTNEVPTKQSGVEPLSLHARQPGPVTVFVPGSHGNGVADEATQRLIPPVSNEEVRLSISPDKPRHKHDKFRHRAQERDAKGSLKPESDFLGATRIDDLSIEDRKKITALAFIELSSLFDAHNIRYLRKKRKKKVKESGLFGVPLSCMLEHDQKKYANIRVPLLYKQLITFLEQEGLKEEGILRVPGSVARVKHLRQELEEKLHTGQFKWDNVRASDAASLLKQFLRELPVPLLTHEYLDAFSQIEKIKDPQQQLEVLKQLVLLLPDVNRDCLLLLLKFLQSVANNKLNNKMNINNVSMIMAPNLFLVQSSQGSKQSMQMEVNMAAGTSNIMRMLIKHQEDLWLVPESMVWQIRKQREAEQQRKPQKDKKQKKQAKKDKADLYKAPLNEGDGQEPVIRVEAPLLTKFFTAIQLEPGTLAGDVVAKCKRGSGLASPAQREAGSGSVQNGRRGSSEDELNEPDMDNLYLYEIGGNIGKRRVDNQANMLALYRVNPNATWAIEILHPL